MTKMGKRNSSGVAKPGSYQVETAGSTIWGGSTYDIGCSFVYVAFIGQ